MKKRVGIMTLYNNNNNYGGIAQSFATQKYIESLGFECLVINYKRSQSGVFKIENTHLKGWKRIANAIIRRVELVGECLLSNKIEMRKKYFSVSREMIPHTREYNENNIKDCNDSFDIFISGSDQIWKPFVMQMPYVLNFVQENKIKLSYSSSISQTNLSDEYGLFMKKNLIDYRAISVRENDAKQYLEGIMKQPVDWVVDPVLLLSRDEWKKLCKEKPIINQPYVFCYLLGDRKEERRWAKEFCRKNKKKLVVFPHVEGRCRLYDMAFGDDKIYDAGLPEFLTLIRDADSVITDSFHAVVFSYIMQRQFWALPRRNKHSNENMSSRLTSVLYQMDLPDRMIDINQVKPMKIEERLINYEKTATKLENQIIFSKKFLKNNLDMYGEEK